MPRYPPEKLRERLKKLHEPGDKPVRGRDDPRKVSVILSQAIFAEMRREAKRLERPLSQIAQIAWRIARAVMAKWPTPRNDDKGQ
jgi:uncharacterized small protein (TIGR04563 family)